MTLVNRTGNPTSIGAPSRRPMAFTLIELLVSLAVLSVALAVVATVFSISTKTATQAAAYSQTQSWLRRFTMELREDLRGIVPAESVLVLRGRTIPASLTPETLDARQRYRVLIGNPQDTALLNALGGGENSSDDPASATVLSHYGDPRADLMMFLTNRAMASNAPPAGSTTPLEEALQNGTKFAPAFVTYGHAALANAMLINPGTPTARYVPEPETGWRHVNQRRGANGGISNNPTDPSRISAQEWILARRQLLVINDPSQPPAPASYVAPAAWIASDSDDGNSFLLGLGGVPQGTGQVLQPDAGDAIQMVLTRNSTGLAGFLPQFTSPGVGTTDPALVTPYGTATVFPAPAGRPLFAVPEMDRLMSLMYPGGLDLQNPLGPQTIACVISNPPPDLKSNLSLQALPGCVWFQVEFLQPEDPRNHPDYFDWTPDQPGDNATPTDALRWVQVPNGAIHVFVPDSLANRRAILEAPPAVGLGEPRAWGDFGALPPAVGVAPPDPGTPAAQNLVRVRTFPYAIRITVRATDPKGRLNDPIVRTVIHRFD